MSEPDCLRGSRDTGQLDTGGVDWLSSSSGPSERRAGGGLGLLEHAHQVCPYSNATRGNIEVTLTLA